MVVFKVEHIIPKWYRNSWFFWELYQLVLLLAPGDDGFNHRVLLSQMALQDARVNVGILGSEVLVVVFERLVDFSFQFLLP